MISTTQYPTATVNGTWESGALATNPSQDDVLVDTGQLVAGDYFISFEMHSTAATKLIIAHRNAANDADLDDYEVPCPADTSIPVVVPVKLAAATNERFIVRCKANITGDAQASIFFGRVVG
jgi:hypothetical protein